MSSSIYQRTPVVLWPIVLVWKLITGLVELTGILIALLVGFAFMMIGVALCLTVIGSVIGVPLLFLGILITLRAIY